MFVILWEFEVKPGYEERFESAYGSNGTWVQLFQRDPHFRGTRLHPDPSRSHIYFTLDFWDSEISYQNFLSANREAYDETDRSNEGLFVRERQILSCALS